MIADVKHDILIDLDCLFDTRLPIVYAIDENTAEQVLKKNIYNTRVKDVFGVISNDIFKAFYKNRDKKILTMGLPTNMFKLLGDYCIETRSIKKYTNDVEFLTVYLNVYPYALTIEEQDNIINALEHIIPNVIFKPVSMSISELTPRWIKKHIGTFYKYDGIDWLEYHTAVGNLTSTPIMDVSLYSPAIVKGNIKIKDINEETFSNMMLHASSLVNLILINSTYFSIKNKKTKQ